MMLSAGRPSRSVRDAPGTDGSAKLLVGGEGHGVGRVRSENEHVERLRSWTQEYYPDAVETHAWSAQDYASHDGLPYVGPLPRGGGDIYLATGYDKWGMTNAVASALDLTGQILGAARRPGPSPYTVGSPGPEVPCDWVGSTPTSSWPQQPAWVPLSSDRRRKRRRTTGTADVGRVGLRPVGTSNVDGQICSVVALCTHLGGALKWNDAESSWDCPLHGSRFRATGEVLEGPATAPLRSRND